MLNLHRAAAGRKGKATQDTMGGRYDHDRLARDAYHPAVDKSVEGVRDRIFERSTAALRPVIAQLYCVRHIWLHLSTEHYKTDPGA